MSRPGPRITGTLPLGEEPHDRNAPRHPPTREEVPIKLLVPGDVVYLSAGDMVPADLILVSSKDLFFSQSILTGYCALTQVVKQWFVRQYGSWL